MEEKRGHQQLEDLEVVCGCVFSFSCGSDRSYIRCLYLEACSKHVPKRGREAALGFFGSGCGLVNGTRQTELVPSLMDQNLWIESWGMLDMCIPGTCDWSMFNTQTLHV